MSKGILLVLVTAIIAGCSNEGIKIADIPNPENMHVSENALYVSATNGIYRLTPDAGTKIYDHPTCSFAGSERFNNWLLFLCNNVNDPKERALYGINLELPADDASLVYIGPVGDYLNPNGIAMIDTDPSISQATFLMTNSDYTGKGGLAELTISLQYSTPIIVMVKDIPLDTNRFPNPNGVKYIDGKVYLTALGYLYRLTYHNGSILNSERLMSITTILDDLVMVCENILGVTDYALGRVYFYDLDRMELVHSTSVYSYENPSALALFNGALVISEKGFFRDRHTSYGNEVSVVEMESSSLCH